MMPGNKTLFTVLVSLITTLLALKDRKHELSGIESYELIHFNLDRFASHHELEFDLSGTHYKVQLIPNDHVSPQVTTDGEPTTATAQEETCHYFGTVLEPQQSEGSYLSLSLCPERGIRGSITTGSHDTIWIMPSAYYFDLDYDRKGLHRLTDPHLAYISRTSAPDDETLSTLRFAQGSRHLLGYNDNNQVELFVLADPSVVKRFKDDYSTRWQSELKKFVQDLINGVSAKYKEKEWGPAGNIEVRLVYLEIATSYSGDYQGLYPNFAFGDTLINGRKNCKDPLGYGKSAEGGCYITGSADGEHRSKAMISKFNVWQKQYKRNQAFDAHLILVGNKMAGIAGVAYRGGMCDSQWNSAAVNVKYNSLESDTKTLCHELGHNFGMTHNVKCDQCIMGKWISWYPWTFAKQAYDELNDKDRLGCLKNGVRRYGEKVGGSGSGGGSSGGGGTSGGGGGSSGGGGIERCLEVKGVSSYYNGEWKASGSKNGRTAYYRRSNKQYLFTALDDWGTKVWTINRNVNAGLNRNYYCYKTFIQSCTGNWRVSNTRKVNSRFSACGAFTSEEEPDCVRNNEYGDTVSLSNGGSLWEDEFNKEFAIATEECLNEKPIYQHIKNENVSYHLYYDEYPELAGDNTRNITRGQWVISLHDLSANVAAQCDETDLLQCLKGKWRVLQQSNDSMELVVDESMSVSQSAARGEEGSSESVLIWIGLILAFVIILAVCGYFVYSSRKSKMNKAVEVDSDEEVVEIEVEQTNLTQTNENE